MEGTTKGKKRAGALHQLVLLVQHCLSGTQSCPQTAVTTIWLPKNSVTMSFKYAFFFFFLKASTQFHKRCFANFLFPHQISPTFLYCQKQPLCPGYRQK